MRICNGKVSAGITCDSNATATQTFSAFDITGAYPYVGIGYEDIAGPDTIFKDIRFYHNTSLDET